MLSKIVDVKVVAPHVLSITFSDGFSAIHDFVGQFEKDTEVTRPLRDPDYFARVFLDYGALTWPNGFDMCPDWTRMEMNRKGALRDRVPVLEVL